MKIVIDIPEEEYKLDKWVAESGMGNTAIRRILDGEPYEERKTGKWIEKDGWDGDVYYDCSICGESWTTIEGTPWDNDMNYCPHCGAKMEGSEEDAEKL